MSFPRYPAYKTSGVEWLDEVPEHWEVIRLKNVLACRITDGPHTTPEFIDEGVPFLSVDGIQGGELNFEGCRYISEEDYEEYRKKARPKKDDLLMGKAASTGKIARVKTDTAFGIWSPLALIRVDSSQWSPSFYEQALKSPASQAQIEVLCTSNTQKNISMDDIPRLTLTRPSHDEQKAIANFLDRETAKIDALIAEQQRLIELLQEKRQAVISHAVTKGLNPKAPMKDSGVKWLGKVPEHWEVKQLVRLVTLQRGHDITKDSQEEGVVPVLSSGGISSYHSRAICEGPAIVVGRKGTAGSLFYVEGDFWPHDTTLYSVDLHGNRAKYCFYYLHSIDLPSFDTGSSNPTLNRNRIHPFKIASPTADEQEEIVKYLDRKTQEIDLACKTVQSQIVLLAERRSALISAAVTGQIDVRGLVPEGAEQ